MSGLDKLPGFQRSPHGLEWAVLKRLPAVLAWGTALPMAAVALLWWGAPSQSALAAADADRLLVTYRLVGLVLFHWSLVLTVAIGCAIVTLMKGPAYVADPYPPDGR
jgi:hypothetical protein